MQAPTFAYGLLDTTATPTAFSDSSLTRYYYEQSVQTNGDALVFYGDVYPEVIVTDTVETAYYRYDLSNCTSSGCPSQVGGYGFLTQEVLDRIDASGFDFSEYDQNADGKIDYVYIMVRGTPRWSEARGFFGCGTTSENGTWCDLLSGFSGVSELTGAYYASTNWGGPQPTLVYDGLELRWTLGTYHHVGTPFNVQLATVGLASHEVGHDIWSDFYNHLAPVLNNRVTADEPPNPTSR